VAGSPVSNPWIQSGLNGLLGAAPSLHTAMNGGKYLEIVGPPEALSGTLSHMMDSEGRLLGGLVNENGQLAGQTRFQNAAKSLNAAAAAAVVFQVLSVATSQYYLHQISASLNELEKKVDALGRKLSHLQYGEIRGAVEVIDDIYWSNIAHIQSTGMVDWQPPGKVEFWTRMSNAETALRKNVQALEKELLETFQKFSSSVRKENERVTESYSAHKAILKDLEAAHQSESVVCYLLALRGMMRWHQLVLAFDSHAREVARNGRYNSMTLYMRERCLFMQKLAAEHEFILARPDGSSRKDEIINSMVPALYTVVSITRSHFFKKKREQSLRRLSMVSCDLFSTMLHFREMEDALVTPRTFLLRQGESGDGPQLCLATVETAA